MDFLKLSSGHSLLQRDITNAIFYANRAMLANPYDDENYYLRGSAQLLNNDSINAISSLEEAYNLKKSYKNFAKYFDVILALKKYDPARTLLDDYALKNPEAELCNKQGAYFVATKEWKKAKSILLSCLDLKEDEQQIKLELAKIYYRYNESDSSLHYVNDFLNANPNSTSAMILKAKTLEQISYFTEARKLYNAALEVDSTSTLAIKGLENLDRKVAYLRLKKRKESLQRQVEVLKPLNSKELK